MRGHTLIELTFVLLLLGVTASFMAGPMRRLRDRAAVEAAREALVGVFVEARGAAIEAGGASVRIVEATGLAEANAAGVTLRRVELASEFGVRLELGGTRPDVDLRYDALGLGRMTSQTVVLRRSEATAQLVVSSYGRLRRR